MRKTILLLLTLTLLVALAVLGSGCDFCTMGRLVYPGWCGCGCGDGYGDGNASIDVEKRISIDLGKTWHDADDPLDPIKVDVGQQIKYLFIVTNDGDVTLTNITLTDSDFDVASKVTIVSPLGPGESFQGHVLSYDTGGHIRAAEGLHTNTARATGDYGSTRVEDTDTASYFGINAP